MKGEKANYTIPLVKAFLFPPKTRVTKALRQMEKFVWKHTRVKNTAVSNEVNEFLHKNSKNIPKKIKATLLKEADRIMIFLEDGKELKEYTKKKDEEKKKKEKPQKKEEKTETKPTAEEEEKKKLFEDKKAKEDAAKANEIAGRR